MDLDRFRLAVGAGYSGIQECLVPLNGTRCVDESRSGLSVTAWASVGVVGPMRAEITGTWFAFGDFNGSSSGYIGLGLGLGF